jgi:hypothetical protein
LSECFSCKTNVATFLPPLKDGNYYCVECVIAMANKQVDHMILNEDDIKPLCPHCKNKCELSSMIGFFKCVEIECTFYNQRVTNNIELYRKLESMK